MARPTNKEELLKCSRENYKKLIEYIDSLSDEEKTADFPDGTMNRNIRDVLAHLHKWHRMMLAWYKVGMEGEKPEIPARGYTWKMTPDLNKKIWQDYRDYSLEEVQLMLDESFKDVQKLIRKHSNNELFRKKYYRWTGSTSLGAYLISATSSHYDWAYKLIKNAKKDSRFVT